MFSLEFFGGACVRTESGVLRAPALQQRRIAVLAILACSPGGRMSRDWVIGCLWPESAEATARHRLGDALHGLRKALGRDAILSAGAELHLNPERVRSDVGDFAAALACGDLESAATLHRGPFLDGFFIRAAPGFERWVDEQRDRFARSHAAALEGLATRAESDGDLPAAVEWWRRLAALDPYDSRLALKLMAALEALGQPAAALRHAHAHTAVLRNELDVEPEPEVLAFSSRLRMERARGGSGFETEPGDGAPINGAPRRGGDAVPGLASAAAQDAPVPPAPASDIAAPEAAGPAGRSALSAGQSTLSARRRPLVLLAGFGLVVMGLAIFAFAPEPHVSAGTADRTAVAVLPFENLDPAGPYTYLAAGLHAEVLTQLSRVGGLTVISRTSVMSYEGSRTSLRQIARDLGVGSVVEASVQVLNGRLVVNVQLIDAHTDAQLWANRYDRSLADVLAIRGELASRISAEVGVALSRGEHDAVLQLPTPSAEAYLLYLQAREYHQRPGHDPADLRYAQRFLEDALAHDPDFALAHAALSEVHGRTYWFRYDASPERAERQRQAAETSLRLAPDLPETHIALGWVHLFADQQPRRALHAFERALQGMPGDGLLWEHLGVVHRRLGEWDEAEAAFTVAARLNPRRAQLFNDLGGNRYQFTRRYEDAVAAYDRALQLAPDFHLAAVQKGRTYSRWQGQLDTLRAVLERIPADAALGGLGTRTTQHIQLLLLERRPDSVLHVVDHAGVRAFSWQMAFVPAALYRARAHQLLGNLPAARTAFADALVVADSALREQPNDWRVRVARALALAGLGRSEEALKEADWLAGADVFPDDSYFGPMVAEERASILAQAGAHATALHEIERLLATPSALSVPTLRLDPRWDPLRQSSDFARLLRRHPPN
jgi:DNA-binding SARP family transcriptional activator/TolB-like protein/Flp pilus assembly protein TadD